jgi:hypothetical protein
MEAEEREQCVALALHGRVTRWPLPPADRPDLTAVDALARLALAARRAGGELRVEGPPPPLGALLDLCGLRSLLDGSGTATRGLGGRASASEPDGDGARGRSPRVGSANRSVEMRRQAEGFEEPVVEEAVVPDDPIA